MTNWTREFIGGSVVYVIHAEPDDAIGAANTVFQLLPTLLTGEEIRIRPAVAPNDPNQSQFWDSIGGTMGTPPA
jgi:hypothetical protein